MFFSIIVNFDVDCQHGELAAAFSVRRAVSCSAAFNLCHDIFEYSRKLPPFSVIFILLRCQTDMQVLIGKDSGICLPGVCR